MPLWQNLAPDLAVLDADELVGLFKTLEAPTLDEMQGEFDASMLRQSSWFAVGFWTWALRCPLWPGIWRGKAFRRVDEVGGRGYNAYRYLGRIVQRFPMRTCIAPSRYDGRPAFQLDYRAFPTCCGLINMVDEVRRVRPGVYLLIGTCGFTESQRRVPNPFVLTGPVAPYRGDIGVERRSASCAE